MDVKGFADELLVALAATGFLSVCRFKPKGLSLTVVPMCRDQ